MLTSDERETMTASASSARDILQTLTSTLFAGGYLLESAEQTNQGWFLLCKTIDRFGGSLRYVLGYAAQTPSRAFLKQLDRLCKRNRAQSVIVTPGPSRFTEPEVAALTIEQFLGRLGGGISSLLPLEPNYRSYLASLGANRVPTGMKGTASDLFEIYAGAGLQFITGRRMIPYGRRRSGEAVPDGIIMLTESAYLLFDAKAANDGFDCTLEVIRQFGSYLEDFHERYGRSYGRAHAFLCVAGSFANAPGQLIRRSDQLYADAGTRLTFLDVNNLADAVDYFRTVPENRQSTDWKLAFSRVLVLAKDVISESKAVDRDCLTR